METTRKEGVILLHGLARTSRSMRKLEQFLHKNGSNVFNAPYPSRRQSIEQLSINTISTARTKCDEQQCSTIHFVTHSMGGILVRYYLKDHPISNLGRVVMLSPPNGGSEIVDLLGENMFFKWWNGPAGKQLGTRANSFLQQLGPASFELGIITGNKSINPLLSRIIAGANDGKVSVENAKLKGMRDFLVVNRSHTFIMNDKGVLSQVAHFLTNGKFHH